MPHLPSVCLGWALWVCDNAHHGGIRQYWWSPNMKVGSKPSTILKPYVDRLVRSQSRE
ncbi:unnamed protein product [Penicillium camemberti]|uniref:Str. FM013 n=1 Tax=Penicillium camemberti (strain FM 013) TaxID=1429867 RepID=A0A0G4NYQ3_PENC3|nr:unnamed protein product [Penicillium camemberti]